MWLVDGMNVIGSRPDGWWRDRAEAQRRLARALSAWARRDGEIVAVVFDGRPHAMDAEGIEVAFARGPGPGAADDEIVSRVAAAPEPGAIRVVTSDRELGRRVEALGARVDGSRALRERLEGPPADR